MDGEEKARIVAESFEEGANISEVARRNGVVRGLLTVWRHKFAAAAAGKRRLRAGPDRCRERRRREQASRTLSSGTDEAAEMASLARPSSGGVIEIEVSGARIRVEPGVDLATLSTVLSALRGIR